MARWDDVRRVALALPEVAERQDAGGPSWRVRGKPMLWARALRRSDLAALGDRAPEGEVMGVRVSGQDVKEQLLSEMPDICFTTPHFDGYPALLVRLDGASDDDLVELAEEAWQAQAPKSLLRKRMAPPS